MNPCCKRLHNDHHWCHQLLEHLIIFWDLKQPGLVLCCCRTSKIRMFQQVYTSPSFLSLPLIKISDNIWQSFARSNTVKWLLESISTSILTAATSCWVGEINNKRNTYGCCQWSPVRCLSSGGCLLTWKPRFPRYQEVEWLRVAARWWEAPSMPPEL